MTIDLTTFIAVDLEVKHDHTRSGSTAFGAVLEIYCVATCDERGTHGYEVHWHPGERNQDSFDALLQGRTPVFHNAAYDVAVLRECGISVPQYECSYIAGYNLNPNMKEYHFRGQPPSRYGLRAWGVRLGMPKLEQPSFDEWSPEMLVYCKRDAEIAWNIWTYVYPRLASDPQALMYYQKVDRTFIESIMEMNDCGMYVDQDQLKHWMVEIKQIVNRTHFQINTLVPFPIPGKKGYHKKQHTRNDIVYTGNVDPVKGYEYRVLKPFNPTYFGDIIYVYYRLYGIVLNGTNKDNLPPGYDLTPLILQYRKYTKLLGTYCKPFSEKADDRGFVHASWKQELITGRISCTNPSLQVLPARDEIGSTFRKFVTAPDDQTDIHCVDLANIELRVQASLMALYWQDRRGFIPDDIEYILNIFRTNGDYHQLMADLWEVPRKDAKNITFARNYGSGDRRLSVMMNCPIEVARSKRKQADDNNPSFVPFRNWILDESRQTGGLSYTFFGRRLVYPQFILDPNIMEDQELPNGDLIPASDTQSVIADGERKAFNARIQGTSADIIKILVNELLPELKRIGGRLVACVHDEVVMYCPKTHSEYWTQYLHSVFNREDLLPYVPIAGEPKYANSWYDAK